MRSFEDLDIEVEVEPATITPYQNGPYLVRGPFTLRDQDGGEIPTSRRTIALCRCGKSRMRPYCDGTHKLIDFRAPGVLETWPPAPAGEETGRAEEIEAGGETDALAR
jgi:CDGSH-type Zn-finger protein